MDQGPAQRTTLRTRSIFISDVHLGCKGCQAQYLLDFLRRVECDMVYLVGDVIDLWALRRSFYWPQAHNDVITRCNDGDWVESCTALVEDFSGRLSLLRWTESQAVLVCGDEYPLLDSGVPASALVAA